jgi:hypothetical protein
MGQANCRTYAAWATGTSTSLDAWPLPRWAGRPSQPFNTGAPLALTDPLRAPLNAREPGCPIAAGRRSGFGLHFV